MDKYVHRFIRITFKKTTNSYMKFNRNEMVVVVVVVLLNWSIQSKIQGKCPCQLPGCLLASIGMLEIINFLVSCGCECVCVCVCIIQKYPFGNTYCKCHRICHQHCTSSITSHIAHINTMTFCSPRIINYMIQWIPKILFLILVFVQIQSHANIFEHLHKQHTKTQDSDLETNTTSSR